MRNTTNHINLYAANGILRRKITATIVRKDMLPVTYKRFFSTAVLLLWAVVVISQPSVKILLVNPLSEERKDELIVLSKKILERKIGKIPDNRFLAFKNDSNLPMLVQFDDINKDSIWDEVAFLYSFGPNEKIRLTISLSDQPATIKAIVRAHVRLSKKNADDSFGPPVDSETMPLQNPATDFSKQRLPFYLTEGPGWENDKVAFRQYMDVRNGRDIYGKRIPDMVMDSVGMAGQPSYHDLHYWGMDVLHVGKSLGAGAIALQAKVNGKDTLIRLGGNNVIQTVYTRISDGPFRAIFRMKYKWSVNGRIIYITDETSIWGGQYFYESHLTIKGAPAGSKLVAGIANFNENISKHFVADKVAILFSHGKQSENKDNLGMGILVKKVNFAGFGTTPDAGSEILNTYIVAQNITASPLAYRFYTGWEKTDSRFSDAHYFDNFLRLEAKKMAVPILIYYTAQGTN